MLPIKKHQLIHLQLCFEKSLLTVFATMLWYFLYWFKEFNSQCDMNSADLIVLRLMTTSSTWLAYLLH